MAEPELEQVRRPTLWQRRALRRLAKMARKRPGEPLAPEDWAAYYLYGAQSSTRAWLWLLRSLPHSPRCSDCGAPFAGLGGRLVRPLGYRPSRKNPYICATCVELSPPGGMTMEAGVMFADLRGFTALSESREPDEVSALLRRFYACAEDVLLSEALIDKLIGDEVMALYLPFQGAPGRAMLAALQKGDEEGYRARLREVRRARAGTMLEDARRLLACVGYGSAEGPFVEVGVGLDYGEAHVGNIGDRAVYDFTAVGDVVNTASRLQGEAEGGEILVSARLADEFEEPPGEPVEVSVKGKAEPVAAYRLSPFAPAPVSQAPPS
jgi:adenylate cyclase